VYFLLGLLPNTNYAFADIIWKSILVFSIFIPTVLYLNLSEDINKIRDDIKSRFNLSCPKEEKR
jgi:hypothetical protein